MWSIQKWKHEKSNSLRESQPAEISPAHPEEELGCEHIANQLGCYPMRLGKAVRHKFPATGNPFSPKCCITSGSLGSLFRGRVLHIRQRVVPLGLATTDERSNAVAFTTGFTTIMKSRSSKLFAPIAVGLLAIGAVALYQLSNAQSFAPEAAQAATLADPGNDPPFSPKPAPEFDLKDLDGKSVHLADFKGKVLVLNFWASWCPPCRKEIPDFNAIQKDMGAQGVQFLGVAMDEEGAAKLKPWLEKNPLAYPIVLFNDQVVKDYGVLASIPVTFVIDRKGVIQQSYTGPRQRAVLEGYIKPLL